MTEELLLQMISSSPEAILLLNTDGEVLFSNSGAQNLLGEETFFPESCSQELQVGLDRARQGKQSYFKVKQEIGEQKLHLLFTLAPVLDKEEVKGVSCFVREVDFLRKISSTQAHLNSETREPKRTFKQIRNRIILSLGKGRMTINQIAGNSSINWKTVEKHLTFLIGKKQVEEIFSSEYVRIFELTSHGKQLVEELKNKEISKIISQTQSEEKELVL